MKYYEIVFNTPLNTAFTYCATSVTKGFSPSFGKRAEVLFGKRKATGFIISENDEIPKGCPVKAEEIKPILNVIDENPVLTEELFETAKWISQYYLCSLGEAISIILPSAKKETNTQGFSFAEDAQAFEKKTLSEEQQNAVDGILSSDGFHYLYGKTGSGKTEVFLTATEKLLEKGKGAIYLVPEISLTAQVAKAVINRFGQTAAVIHSGLTPKQKLSEWHRILNREARIVIGARSAIFAPVPDLGLIIIDEEHDSSYKSGSTPRYHARQVAMYRALKNKIPLVMGSATPSVEAWMLMNQGKIKKHVLTARLAGGKMPEIKAVNLSLHKTMQGCLSSELEDEIRKTLSEKRQTILFLNRRGFSHFFRCSNCGYEQTCKNCSVPLTYHKAENRLRCHYCGWSIEPLSVCPECGSVEVGYTGFGTEFIENEVKAKFPEARTIRIDTDSLSKKGELQDKIDAFTRGEYDILLGTQMVAKGLNFPKLKLVGVVNADTGLHMPDFRAAEKTFSLITQVAGRAGRFFPDGRVIVQSFSPDREPIARSCICDTEGFYKNELEMRKVLNFPPYSRLIRLVFRSPSEESAEESSEKALEMLKKISPQTEILGPAECPLFKIAQNFRFQLILRGANISLLQSAVRALLSTFRPSSRVYIETDVDPVSLL